MKPVFIPPEVVVGMALTGVQACVSYCLCNKLSLIMKSQYNQKLPKAVPMFFTATVLVMAGKMAHLQHRYNRPFAISEDPFALSKDEMKAIAEENRRLRER